MRADEMTVTMPSPLGQTTCRPLDADQARVLATASPIPVMVADVHADGFTVLAVDPLLRRFITGARHPAGPMPGEVIAADGFGVLAPAMSAAVALPSEQQVFELPVGDEPLWFEVTVTAVSGDDGGCHQLLLLGADRTAEHDMEARQRRNVRRFQAMVTHAPGLILLVDSTGRIVRASPGVEHLIGVAAAELIGRPIFELMHPDTLASAASTFNHILSQPGIPVDIADFRMSHVDGGEMWCEAIATNLLHDDDVAAIVFNAHDVTERRLAEQRLELSATTDALTGLANRRRLEAHLQEIFLDAAAEQRVVALALVDLDDFKLVNDTLGHDVGDEVLRALANRFDRLLTDRGSVARIGGDEFALVIAELTKPSELQRLSEAVHETLRAPVNVGEHTVYVRASIGVTTASPATADPSSLLRSADLALYRAKRNGRNQTVRFTAELHLEAEERLRTISELQRAIREGRLRLAYQPIIGADGATIGAEALLRWEHDGELLSPQHFLALAEDTGLILPIGTWVLEQACRDLRALQDALPRLEFLSVNLSSRQLLDERLPLLVRQVLREHAVEPGTLAMEIDDTTLREDERTLDVIHELEGVSLMVSLNDPTRDQGILTKLGTLPISVVKIGKSLVQQLDVDADGRHAALVMGVVDLAADLGVGVVAEGVETEAQARVLGELGCPAAQGFLFSAALDLASFITRAQSD